MNVCRGSALINWPVISECEVIDLHLGALSKDTAVALGGSPFRILEQTVSYHIEDGVGGMPLWKSINILAWAILILWIYRNNSVGSIKNCKISGYGGWVKRRQWEENQQHLMSVIWCMEGWLYMLEWAGGVVSGHGTSDYFSNFQECLLVLEMEG